MQCLEFVIEGVPVPKGRPRFFNGHAVTPARTREYEKLVHDVAVASTKSQEWIALDVDHHVELDIYRARRSGDVENFAKSVMDGMNKVVYSDDRHVASLHVVRFEDKKHPRVEVRIFRYEE